MPRVVFAHGWGFDKTLWVDTIKRFKINDYYLLDFGYTGNRDIVNICQTEPVIGIGHSLGFAWLLQNLESPVCLISISGFDCFFRIYDWRDIEAMRRNLTRNKQKQMRVFHKKAGTKLTSVPNFKEKYLIEGLNHLQTWDLNHKLNSLSVPIFAIASQNDKIVPLCHSKRIFENCILKIISRGDHVIPMNNRSDYFKFIEEVFREFGI
tara:strand:- start:269 stop:892 length:624 start_codon:yes stop_codon:yes gene_type:complete